MFGKIEKYLIVINVTKVYKEYIEKMVGLLLLVLL